MGVMINRRRVMGGGIKYPSDAIMTIESNPEVLAICYSQGWCLSDKYMTASEAASVTSLEASVFQGASQITHFEEFQYFTGLTSVPGSCFRYCTNLEVIYIPDNVVTIGARAFNVDLKLRYVHLGRSVARFSDNNLFPSNANAAQVTVSINGPSNILYYFNGNITNFESDVYTSIDGILYDGTTLFACPLAKTGTFYTPSWVTKIGSYAFCWTSFTNLVINEGVTEIGNYGLQGASCQSLTLPSTLERLGTKGMNNMQKLNQLTSYATTAPIAPDPSLDYIGRQVSGTKTLYIPVGATGYDSGEWGRQLNGWTVINI